MDDMHESFRSELARNVRELWSGVDALDKLLLSILVFAGCAVPIVLVVWAILEKSFG